MARIRSVDFLPEIFQTETNKKFLNSTLDQLIQEPKFKEVQGYIGRRNAPGATPTDGYVLEPTADRTNYQLEPGVTFKDSDGKTIDALSYLGLINGLKAAGANVDNHDRLFRSETYSWSPFIDFDKFVNYSQYFWLPAGPDSVDVGELADGVLLTNDFNMEQEEDTYSVEDYSIDNPIITVARGGEYTFNVNQPGQEFFIQAQPGADGTMPWAANISSRDVLGVSNNGEDSGAVQFNVPQSNAQDFYHNLTSIGDVDLATSVRMDEIADQLLDDVGEHLGIQNINNNTIVFLNDQLGDAVDLGWINNGIPLTTLAERYQVFKIVLEDVAGDVYVRLNPYQLVNNLEKFTVQYGNEHSNKTFYKTQQGVFKEMPILTASLTTLYYQDSSHPDRFGVINIVDANESPTLNISDILGRTDYTSANAVVFTNGLKVKFRGNTNPAEYSDNEYFVEGVGTAIKLVAVSDLIIPEAYAKSTTAPWDTSPFDSAGLDGTLNAPLDQDYITINRSSIDRNAWSRSNRWFHIDVITKTAEYNNVVLDLDNNDRADRPVIEFDADLRLFNYGTNGKDSINIVDTTEVDALSNVNDEESYTIDGYNLVEGSRVVFAADADLSVRNKIYVVELVDLNNNGTETINLTLAEDSESENNDVVLVTNGLTQQGAVFTFTNNVWVQSQQKESVNQAPLFDVFDTAGTSLSDLQAYPSTSFAGTKAFSYAEGTGLKDKVLGFPLKYLNIDNLGDIVFENNLYTDTFIYVENSVSKDNSPVGDGYLRKYSTREEYTNEIGWSKTVEESYLAQILNFEYTGAALELDVLPKVGLSIPAVHITINNEFINPSDYTVTDNVITCSNIIAEIGDTITVNVISDEVSKLGYYEIPSNIASNMFNENTDLLTLGTIRNHFNNLSQHILDIDGDVNGANNLRDLGDISRYGNLIVQQSAPLALAAMFMRNKEYNFFSATEFNARQYEKFKNQLMDWVSKNEVYGMDAGEVLDAALKELNANKHVDGSFYWSDMLATGEDFEATEYGITAISTNTFTTLYSYNYTSANSKALLVYVNNELLTKDAEYTVANDGPRIEILTTLDVGDIVTIKEYNTTVGSGIPSTPTKMGMYPKFKPELYTDNTYVKPTDVIRGHDGSVTVAHGDFSDDVLLEFEKRVYNNIKVNAEIPLLYSDVQGGQFRFTDYTDAEINQVLAPSLLSWLGWNRIDYKTQDYNKLESKTWNYSSAQCKEGDKVAKGNWRGIYNCFYDTDAPHERPWEMLGLTEQPTWWKNRYGPAPYTAGNLVLWDDLEIGLIKEPGNERIAERFVRPGLTNVLPVDGEGKLLMPLDTVISDYTEYDFKKSWALGDHGPAETAWRKSSAFPYAVQTLLALTKPAQYFSLMADRDRYTYNTDFNQYLYDERHRIDSRKVEILEEDTFKHSYINWIVDYNKHYGYNSSEKLKEDMSNLGVSLMHHMASFTDKNSLRIFTDKSSPDSTNSSLLLPDESYNLLMYKNQPFDEIIYSSVIVQKTEDGYSVSGNSATNPYFKIFASEPTGQFKTITVGRTERTSTSVNVPKDFTEEVVFIPYGHVFRSRQAVADFIVSYNKYLVAQGLQFNDAVGTIQVDWEEMVKEFIYWTDQGWSTGSVVNLNPSASTLEFERELVLVDDLNNLELNEQPLDQNREPLQSGDYVVDRIDNNFKIRMLNNNVISYLKFNLTNFEHLLVLDNVSIFNDLMYDPVTGVRQHRVKLSGFATYDWNGQLDAQGFLYNDDNVVEWSQTNSYNTGDIVKFKNSYWSAAEKLQPAAEFDFSKWVKTNYNDIKKGLLPNIATKADQQLDFYNNKTANLESDVDLMALGLTGFRARDYLRALDLHDISQAHIYSDMIQSKGTADSLNLFQDVILNNEVVDYEIYENWAIKRAEFGASSSRSYIELQLDETFHTSNPSIVEVVNATIDAEFGDQTITTANIYKQSEKNIDKNILPTNGDKNLDTMLPSAGFVNPDDVDIAIFELADFPEVTDVIDGTLVWVAKDTVTDWNVYRAFELEAVITDVLDNLDGSLTLIFDTEHGLAASEILVVQNVDAALVDGTHIISSVTDDFKVVIPGELAQNQTTIDDVTGTALKFLSVRMENPSSIAGSFVDNRLFATDTVWINEYNSKGAVYEKSSPFTPVVSYISPEEEANSEYGYDVVQGYNGAGMMVSDPAINTKGQVFCFDKFGSADYILNQVLKLRSTEVARYGESLAMSEEWAVIGAPGDGASIPGVAVLVSRDKVKGLFNEIQVMTHPDATNATLLDTEFGKNVTLSTDENWLYVSEPNANKVHSYQKVEHQAQTIATTMDGITQNIFVEDVIKADTKNELSVTLDGNLLSTAEYEYDGTNVVFDVTPADGVIARVSRLDSNVFDGNGSAQFTINNVYALNGIDSIRVAIDGNIQRPRYDYTLAGNVLTFTTAPDLGTNNIVVTVDTHFAYVSTIAEASGDFSTAVDATTDSSHIIITAPADDKAYIYDRVVERFVVHKDDALLEPITFTLNPIAGRTVSGNVFVNGVKQIKEGFNVNPNYSVSGNTITFITDNVKVGDFVDVDTTEFKEIQTLTGPAGSSFGNDVSICKSKCSIYFGAENDNDGEGSVVRYVNKTRMYGIIQSTIQDLTVSVGDSLRVNNVEIVFTGTTIDQVAQDVNDAAIPNVIASVNDGYLIIELKNKTITSIANKLDVLPGKGTTMASLGLQSYYNGQTITSPQPAAGAHFGSSVQIDLNLNQLIVAAVNGPIAYGADTTEVLADTTAYTADMASTGVVYTYDLLPDATEFSEGKLVFGQQVIDDKMVTTGLFGNAVSLVDGTLVVASIAYDTDTLTDVGRVAIFENKENKLSWNAIKTEKDIVDVSLINSVFIYNNETFAVEQYLDYIDPLNGKILGVAKQNIDYIETKEPTVYGSDFTGALWGKQQVGQMWWDISTCRFVDYNQNDSVQASKLWGKMYPGSSVDVYQWIESDVTPDLYDGAGTVYDVTKFVTMSEINNSGIIQNTYYYWVKGVNAVDTNAHKTLSADAVAQYIESPISSGIAYCALIDQNIVGLYNCKEIINSTKSVLHIEYDKIKNDNNVFHEYSLLRENFANDFLPDGLYKKFQDSLCGVDSLGNKVPDVNLSYSDRFGIDFRPRKSMFIDKFAALTSYLERVNAIMKLSTIAESRVYPLLNSEEPIPAQASGAWDEKVFNTEELSFQDLNIVPAGHTYLLETDSNSNGLWAIYEVTATKTLQLKRVQSYDTKRFWSTENWYAEDFSPFTKSDYVVGTYAELAAIDAANNAVAKVLENSVNKWEIYRYETDTWVRVALESGTIQFNERLWNYDLGRYGWDTEVFDAQYNDEEPVIELRKIIQSINEEILIGDLAVERNKAFMSMFNYILSEQPHVDWLYKTSLIDVNHRVRSLSQYAVYQKDNQDYLADYIKEAKPYHTKIKDLLLSYDGNDVFDGSLTDFDCPAVYSDEYNKFISPILDDGAILTTDVSNVLADDAQWQTSPWAEWYNNYRLNISEVEIVNPGSGYTFAPTVTVTGDCVNPAELIAVVSGTGEIKEIEIVKAGCGYISAPIITIEGGNGNGATALAITGNNVVRTLNTTIKYDRYEYESNVVEWEALTEYTEDQLVRVNNAVYKVLTTEESAETFNPALHELVDIETLSGIDRTTGYYVSDVNNPGLDLSLLINGIAYPGVEVDSVHFAQSLDSVGPEGLPTYSEEIIDTIYESAFLDTYLGTTPIDINIDGGMFIDTYHSHAPDELVPGAMFDTLDIKVFSRPGSDYNNDGHGFDIQSVTNTASGTTGTFSFDAAANHAIELVVVNLTTGATLYEGANYSINWTDKTVEVTSGIVQGDEVKIFVYEIGGGNQLYRATMTGDEANNTFTVPAKLDEIYNIVMFANGVELTNVTTTPINNQSSLVTITGTLQADAFVTVTVFGFNIPQRDESYPVTQTFIYGTDALEMDVDALTGKNRHNAIVEVNGLRLQPEEGVRSIANGINTTFLLPQGGNYSHDLVADNEVSVYVNDVLLANGIDYTLSPAAPQAARYGTAKYGTALYYNSTGNFIPRYVILNTAPVDGQKVEVFVSHETAYEFDVNTLILDAAPTNGDIVAVTTFKDVRELDILTEVYVGPTQIEEAQLDLYDTEGYDTLAFDLTSGVDVDVNVFRSSKIALANTNRLWVTLNGERLAAGEDYRIENTNELVLTIPVISETDVVAVTSITDSIITDGSEFRIFKDMRDSVGMYKISDTTTTELIQDLNIADDIIHVRDASVLGQPNLAIAKFGILTINGERITYRERDLLNNTVSGLRRGTAGTGAADLHSADDRAYDISSKSFVQWDYDRIWYAVGDGEASNGIPLQDQATIPALFIKK